MGLVVFFVYWAFTGHLPGLGLVVAFLLGATAVSLNNAITKNEEGGK